MRSDQLPKGSAHTAPARANSAFAAEAVVPLPSPRGELCGALSSSVLTPAHSRRAGGGKEWVCLVTGRVTFAQSGLSGSTQRPKGENGFS